MNTIKISNSRVHPHKRTSQTFISHALWYILQLQIASSTAIHWHIISGRADGGKQRCRLIIALVNKRPSFLIQVSAVNHITSKSLTRLRVR